MERNSFYNPGDLVVSPNIWGASIGPEGVEINKGDIGMVLEEVWYKGYEDCFISHYKIYYKILFGTKSIMFHPTNLTKYKRTE